jgi:hypothetical protein
MWTKEAYQAYLKSAHWKAVQKAIYRMKPLCFIHRRHCRKLKLNHLKYDNLSNALWEKRFPPPHFSLTGALQRSPGFLSHRQLLCFTFPCLTSITIVLS